MLYVITVVYMRQEGFTISQFLVLSVVCVSVHCVFACLCVCECVYVCVHVCVHVCVCICARV